MPGSGADDEAVAASYVGGGSLGGAADMLKVLVGFVQGGRTMKHEFQMDPAR
jgi:hypothetical protein